MKGIPDGFSIFGQDITVRSVSDLHVREDCYGKWQPNTNEILLQEKTKAFADDVLKQAFWHETTHAIFDTLGHTKISEDEQLVEQVGQAIYQVLKTKY